MKKVFFLLLLFINFTIYSQAKNSNAAYIKTIREIHKDFIFNQEDTDSQDNKKAMKNALKSLKNNLKSNDIKLIIEVWMDYDPMDYPTKELVLPLLKRNKKIAVQEIDKKLKVIKDIEDESYIGLLALKNSL